LYQLREQGHEESAMMTPSAVSAAGRALAAPDRAAWAERALRRFRWMLGGLTALFLLTEVVGLTGLVRHIRPVYLYEITSNILFAIGFGSPLLLHLSSLPPWRELRRTLLAGALLWLLLVAPWAAGRPGGPFQALTESDRALLIARLITGLGLASIGALSLRAWDQPGPERTVALLYLLPSLVALVFTFEACIFMNFTVSFFPTTYDSFAYAADEGYGFQPSFVVGRLFAAQPVLAGVCQVIYIAASATLAFVFTLQLRARRPPPVDALTVLLALVLIGYSFYFFYPVCGPIFAFGTAFPNFPASADEVFAGGKMAVEKAWRNGMPSLHLGSALLAYWHAWPYGRWARVAAGVFVTGTALATLGLGEHYFVDLVVALPFALGVHALCTPGLQGIRRERNAALIGSLVLLALWYALLLYAVPVLHGSPPFTWGLTLISTAAVFLLQWRLHCATALMPGAPTATSWDARRTAPGPRGQPVLGNLWAFRQDVLRLLLDSQRQFGDVVRFRLGPMLIHLVSHPDQVRHVLVTNQHNYNKATRSSSKIESITGTSLLTANGDFWLQQRRLMQPAFLPQQIGGFLDIMTEATADVLKRWQHRAAGGQPLDIASEMMRLTYTIVGTALFGADVTDDIEVVERAATIVMGATWRRLEKIIELPEWFPTRRHRRFRQALRQIDEVVHRISHAGRQGESAPTNLLSLLLHGRDEATGQGMTAQQLRNETITLLLAGHETTANALTWTWYLLSRHPEVARRLRAELAEVLGARTPTLADLSRLNYTTKVLREAMRLYPPIWIMERHALADDTIAGYHIPAGSTVVLSPWVTHRHPEFWENPEGFDPERFAPEPSAGRSHYAYIPFGAGQRLCIGNHFALLEAQVIVTMVSQRYQLDLVPGFPVVPRPGITLRPRYGLQMTLRLSGKGP
jgi:cytochrome P450